MLEQSIFTMNSIMKHSILSLILALIFAVGNAQHQGHNMPATATGKVIYTCPMHPKVQSEKPGLCPLCGMELEKKKVKKSPALVPNAAKASTPSKNVHSMHIDAKSMNMPQPAVEKNSGNNAKSGDVPMPMTGFTPLNTDEPLFAGSVNMQPGKTVRYDLYVTDTTVNYTGKVKHAYAVNGTLPGPDLVFTEGDTAAIYVHNNAHDETSIHWHGVILPNEFDGVPYLTTSPIHPGSVHLYKFAVQQNGTYWYHSHSGLQEQAGIYGALIFHKRPGQSTMAMQKANDGIMKMDMPMDHSMHQGMQQSDKTMGNMEITEKDSLSQRGNNVVANKPQTAGHTMGGGMDMKEMDMSNMDMHAGNHMPMSPDAKKGNGSYNKEQTVVLSEWTNENPKQVQRRLRTVNDWYAIKKGSTQSYSEAIASGHLGTKVMNEWKRMNAMDVSDVYYDRFLINGRQSSEATGYKAGDRVRMRIVNAGASSYFWLGYGGGKMTVIANDGNEVEPIEVDRLIVGVSETYDVVVTIPTTNSFEFRATPEDRTKAASLWLGSGPKMPAPVLPRLKYFEGMKMMNDMMAMNGDMKAMDMVMTLQKMDMNMVMYDEINNPDKHPDAQPKIIEKAEAANMVDMQGMAMGSNGITTLNYGMLQSPTKTVLPEAPYKQLEFELTGNMNRYVWSINNKVISEWDKILIERGQNVRVVLYNNSMMRHPMHLHGHDFRVLNGQGEYAPLKNVLDIMPMERDTIEFAGNQSGDWFFHCHILYHMMAGMGNVFSYKNSPPNPELPDKTAAYNKFIRSESMLHLMAEIGLESNGSDGKLMLPGERFELRSEWRLGLHSRHGYESETYVGKYLGKMQWWFPFIGFDYHKNNRENELEKNAFGQLTNQNNRKAFVAGIEYTLPMLVKAQARVDSKGKFRFQLGREDIPITPRLRLNGMWNTDKEYMAGFKYVVRKWLNLSTHYDSDMGFGAGVTIVY